MTFNSAQTFTVSPQTFSPDAASGLLILPSRVLARVLLNSSPPPGGVGERLAAPLTRRHSVCRPVAADCDQPGNTRCQRSGRVPLHPGALLKDRTVGRERKREGRRRRRQRELFHSREGGERERSWQPSRRICAGLLR